MMAPFVRVHAGDHQLEMMRWGRWGLPDLQIDFIVGFGNLISFIEF
jgi:hypothetical protein